MRDVSSILTKKNYGKNHLVDEESVYQPKWMEALGILLFACSGLGEGKSINVILGGLPKAVTLGFVGLAILELFIRGDLSRVRKMAVPTALYILYLVVLGAWSLFIWTNNFTAVSSMARGIEKILYQTIATVVAICCAYLYGRKSIDLFVIGICIANTVIMFSEVPAYGIAESMRSLTESIVSLGNSTYGYAERLEIHEVTFLYALFIIYYIFFAPKDTPRQRKRNIILIGCSVFFLLAGMKRILIPALFASCFYVWFIRKREAPEKWVMFTGIAWIILFWVYLYMVHFEYISMLMQQFGINPMGRDYIWKLAKQYYQFSPTYIGLGFEAVDAIVQHFYHVGLIDQAYPLHNDILKVFVELGFPGLCFWCAFLYFILPRYWLKNYGSEAGLLYMALMNPLSLTYLTDNTAFYFWCTMGLRLIPLAVCCYANKKNDNTVKITWQAPSRVQMKEFVQDYYNNKGEL